MICYNSWIIYYDRAFRGHADARLCRERRSWTSSEDHFHVFSRVRNYLKLFLFIVGYDHFHVFSRVGGGNIWYSNIKLFLFIVIYVHFHFSRGWVDDLPKLHLVCNGSHNSPSKNFPQYITRSEIIAKQTRPNLTYRDAEDMVHEKCRKEGRTFNFVLQSNGTNRGMQTTRHKSN